MGSVEVSNMKEEWEGGWRREDRGLYRRKTGNQILLFGCGGVCLLT